MHGIPECAKAFCKLNVTNEPAIISLHLGYHHSACHFLFFFPNNSEFEFHNFDFSKV